MRSKFSARRRATAISGHFGQALTLVVSVIASSAMRPAPIAAQTAFVVAGHVGSSGAVAGGTMVDVATELQQGIWGLRGGVGMDAAGTALDPVVPGAAASSGAWSADADLGLNLARVPFLDVLFGRTAPAVFVGAGMAGIAESDAPDAEREGSVVPTWTYGARAGYPVASWLGFEAEARHRDTFGEVAPEVYPAAGGWEYRVGVALRFGGRAASARPVAAPTRGGSTREAPRRPSGATRPTIRPVSTDEPRSSNAEAVAESAIRTADRYIGTSYRWGGTSPTQGFDCSGFVQYVFAQHGITLPRVSRDQARAGVALPTSLDGLARGDLLFFAQGGPTVDHVAIYAGDGRIVHSSRSGYGVRYDELTGNRGRWYAQHLVAVRRVIPGDAVVDYDAGAAPAMPERALPLDEAFEALTGERGDDAPAPTTR